MTFQVTVQLDTPQDYNYFHQLMHYCELWGINCWTGQQGNVIKLTFSGNGGSIEQLKLYLEQL